MARKCEREAFTLIELLIVVAVIGLLVSILLPSLARAKELARKSVCAANVKHLAEGNMLYAESNREYYAIAAQDIFNDLGDGRGGRFRWHGTRDCANQPFDAARAPLVPYLGVRGGLKLCPTFEATTGSSGDPFEQGAGGYGYNAQYVGGRNDKYGYGAKAAAESARVGDVRCASATVMFTDSGMVQQGASGGATIIEYSFCEPPLWQTSPGPPSSSPTWPSIRFRHLESANAGWADGHVSAQKLTFSNESYGLTSEQVKQAGVGWFGSNSNELFDLN